jgi:hypothetical protein
MHNRVLQVALSIGVLATSGCGAVLQQVVDGLTHHHHRHGWLCNWDDCSDCVTREELASELDERSTKRQLSSGSATDLRRRQDGRLSARAMFEGGHFEVAGQPARHPERVLLSLRPVVRFDAAPCDVRWFRDGEPIAIHQQARKSDRELALIIDPSALRGLGPGSRFAGFACGREIALTGGALAALSQFEARFREQSTRESDTRAFSAVGADVSIPNQI